MTLCRACKLPHPSTERCEVARRRIAAENAITAPVNTAVNTDEPVNTKRKTDRHRPGYMRQYMANYRKKS